MASLRERLGRTIRELRSAANFSQEKFADQIGVHRTFMGTIERGETNVSLETLERVATGLRLHIWELVQIAEVGRSSPARHPRIEQAPEKDARKPDALYTRARKSSDRRVAEDPDE
jgi:transcriptional regulator with XRE-family HTH domain